jgi:hypothetical protein
MLYNMSRTSVLKKKRVVIVTDDGGTFDGYEGEIHIEGDKILDDDGNEIEFRDTDGDVLDFSFTSEDVEDSPEELEEERKRRAERNSLLPRWRICGAGCFIFQEISA